jgi:6-phosphogluconolactonase
MNYANVLLFENQDVLTTFAVAYLSYLAREAVAARGRCLMALSGGGTPQPVYESLAKEPHRDAFPWNETHFLLGDERLVPTNHPDSNLFQAKKYLLDPAGVPANNIYAVNSRLDPAAAAADYAARLQTLAAPGSDWPRLDIALNGLGADGHTASLFPAAENPTYSAPVIAVTAAYADRPAHRVTLTPLVFNDARHLIYLVAGQGKAAAVAAALQGPLDPAGTPTHRLQLRSGRVFWLLDRTAAGELNAIATAAH